jgi:hypothetical protein
LAKRGGSKRWIFSPEAKWRARKNKVRRLKRADGSWTEAPNEMKEMVVGFFEDLYIVDNEVNPDLVLPHVEPKVTQDMNDDLCKDFSEKEISDAMFQMGPLKVLGLDRFYQKHWGIVKIDVVAAMQKFFLDGVLPEGINDTAIVLIPKDNDSEELKILGQSVYAM